VSSPPPTAAVVDVALTAMAHGGEAMGRLEDGRVVFAAGGLPGERVRVAPTETHARWLRGVMVESPEPASPDRVGQPRCPHFGRWPERGLSPSAWCGGCQWQHLSYEAQLRHKTAVLQDALVRLGGIPDPPVEPAIGMAEPWHYRNHLRLHVGAAGVGLVAADRATLLPISQCHITHPLVFELVDALEGDLPAGTTVALRAGIRTGDQMIVLCPPADLGDEALVEVEVDASVALVRPDGGWELAAGRPYLVEELAGRPFLIPPVSFFQVNTDMAEQLVALVGQLLPPRIDTLVDVYSGVGTFAVCLADRCRSVYAIESDPYAVAAAVENATGLEQVTLLEATAAEGLAYVDEPIEVLLVDPPRSGIDRQAMELLATRAADTIVYVSCEPSTLARDARQLRQHGWGLVWSRPVDLFPQTYHLESVSVFRRGAAVRPG
jgi:23S rRNA (uracil1939-C5)-methyltransferase